ncbi:uncharacterized protein ACIBXB_022339, partial [Morphnus guianensis]
PDPAPHLGALAPPNTWWAVGRGAWLGWGGGGASTCWGPALQAPASAPPLAHAPCGGGGSNAWVHFWGGGRHAWVPPVAALGGGKREEGHGCRRHPISSRLSSPPPPPAASRCLYRDSATAPPPPPRRWRRREGGGACPGCPPPVPPPPQTMAAPRREVKRSGSIVPCFLFVELGILGGTAALAYQLEFTDAFPVHDGGFFCRDPAYGRPYPGPPAASRAPPALVYALVTAVPVLTVSG